MGQIEKPRGFSAGAVHGDRRHRVTERGVDESAKHRLGPHLDKGVYTGCMHALDGFLEMHRRSHLTAEQFATRRRFVGVGCCGCVGVNRYLRRHERRLFNRRGKGCGRMGHQGTVKCGGHRQVDGAISPGGACCPGRFDGIAGSGEHPLIRTVDVGQNHIVEIFDQGRQFVDGGFHRQHGARIDIVAGCGHQASTIGAQLQKRIAVDATSGVQGG